MGSNYMMIGQTTGDVWTVDPRRSALREWRLNKPDGSWRYFQLLNLYLTSEDGERLRINGMYRLAQNADGEWTTYKVNMGSCPEIW